MKFIKHQNVASSVITVTSTATGLFSLINTAGSVSDSQIYFTSPSSNKAGVANGLLITPEDGDIRLGYGFTPTANLGTLLSSGTKYFLPNYDLGDVKLIRTSGDVSCSVDIVVCEKEEPYTAVAEAVTLEASSITIGNVEADITKIAGTATDTNSGNKSAGSQRVVIATDDVNMSAIKTAVEKLDDWDESDRAKVNPIAGQAGVAADSGAADALTQRVILATDDPAVTDLAAIEEAVETVAPIQPTHLSPMDGTVAYTSTTSVTCSGFPFTVDDANCFVTHIDYYPTGSTFAKRLVNGVGGVSLKASSNVITVAGAGTPFAASDTYYVGVRYQDKAYTAATDSKRVGEVDPVDEHYVEEELLDTTNITAATHYYPSSTGEAMGNFNHVSLQWGLTDADGTLTLTVEAKNDDSTDWIDITKAGYRLDDNTTGNASFGEGTTGMIDFDNLHVRHIRYKVVASGATNSVQLHHKLVAL